MLTAFISTHVSWLLRSKMALNPTYPNILIFHDFLAVRMPSEPLIAIKLIK